MANESMRLRSRAKLALRAERAFGLSAIIQSGADVLTVAEAHPPDGPLPQPPAAKSTPVQLQLVTPSREAFSARALSTEEKIARLAALESKEVRNCVRCRLCEQRTHTVFGEGSPDAKLVFIGEGPGANEDRLGRPFVGRSGDFLNTQIAAMGLKREDVFICNVVKCRPPDNREPALDEVATCTPYLERQLEIIRPKVIVTLGKPAAHHMLQTKLSMSALRGQWQSWRGIKLMPTFHPAYLLRSYTRENRAMVWSDLQQVMQELSLPVPKKS